MEFSTIHNYNVNLYKRELPNHFYYVIRGMHPQVYWPVITRCWSGRV